MTGCLGFRRRPFRPGRSRALCSRRTTRDSRVAWAGVSGCTWLAGVRRGRRSECGNRRAYREGGQDGGLPEEVSRAPLAWPLDAEALEDLRWYLEDYLPAPFGMWENRGPAVRAKLTGWAGPGRDAYQRARDRGLEVVFWSAEPGLLVRGGRQDGPDSAGVFKRASFRRPPI